jgi:hypothetical protein
MSIAYEITSGVGLALLGFFAMLLGRKCLGEYRAQLHDQPLHVMAWDMVVAALQTGTSLGYLAASLFMVGGAFVLIGAFVTITTVVSLLLR